MSYEAVCRWAVERDIVVNTIYCGDYRAGVDSFWQRGADIAGGSYFAIDSNKVHAGISTPYDDKLLMLNSLINETFVPYGAEGKAHLARQERQDLNAAAFSAPVLLSGRCRKVPNGTRYPIGILSMRLTSGR